MTADQPLLFVYGTLRTGFDGPMAHWLRTVATYVGQGHVAGRLYYVEDYPGFVPGPDGQVIGDLVALADPAATLARLDDYEQCCDPWPQPREYRRAQVTVTTPDGPVEAWTYVYLYDVAGLALVPGGDFLA